MNNYLEGAVSVFEAIEQNTGTRYWRPEDGLRKAIDTFNSLIEQHGVPWLIDAATGSGMSHLGLAFWLSGAKGEAE